VFVFVFAEIGEEEEGNLDLVARGRLFVTGAPASFPSSSADADADAGIDTPPADAPVTSLS